MSAPLSTDLDDPDAVPCFTWDDPMTVRELQRALREASLPERDRLLAKILREARHTEVWRFTTVREIRERWPGLSLHLGRRRDFWRYFLDTWTELGLS